VLLARASTFCGNSVQSAMILNGTAMPHVAEYQNTAIVNHPDQDLESMNLCNVPTELLIQMFSILQGSADIACLSQVGQTGLIYGWSSDLSVSHRYANCFGIPLHPQLSSSTTLNWQYAATRIYS
jgi:hypothetical protein